MEQNPAMWGNSSYDEDPEEEYEDEGFEMSDGNNPGNSGDLSHITCHFCESIIQYAMKFRRLDEEEFLSDIPQFHMEKEDTRGNLTKRAKACKICAMALSAVNDLPYQRTSNQDRDEIYWEFCRPRSKYDRPMLCIVDYVRGTAFFKFRETLGLFLHSFDEAETVVPSQHVRYPVLQRWLEKCLDHGGTLQDLFLINDLKSATIRLIDIEDNCLCDVPTSNQYLALSYMWGTSSGDNDKLMTNNCEKLYAPNGINLHVTSPRTVRDAMEVTKELGFRYLFVDRLCIIQDNNDDKALYVSAMHEIYNKAQVTIVAAAGNSADAGLPGTRGTPRTQKRLYHPRQSVNFDDERDLVRVYEDEFPPLSLFEKTMENSLWSTRGWTYQEEKLAERMLVFTDQAVFWKCAHICLYEDCPHDQNEHLSDGLVDMQSTDPFGRDALWWGRKKKTGFSINGKAANFAALNGHEQDDEHTDRYVKKRDQWISAIFRIRVQEFFERKLTFKEDIARAFDGMIGALKIVYEPLPVHHGMLTRSLPSELTWACSSCVNKSHSARNPHLGLRAVKSGISQFPTWSWHAWLDQPTWFYGNRAAKESNRELDVSVALTTSMYAGTSNPPSMDMVYKETRPIGCRTAGAAPFTPSLWMTQHPLQGSSLIFEALAYQTSVSFKGRTPPRIDSLNKLTDLGLRLPPKLEVPIVDWLQRPSASAFEKSINVICISYAEETAARGEFTKLAVMMVVSFQIIEGKEVAFREGLFTCKVANFAPAQKLFKAKTIFLC